MTGARLSRLVSGSNSWCQAIYAFGAKRDEKQLKVDIFFCNRIMCKILYIYVTVRRMVIIYDFIKMYNMTNLREIPWKFEL